MKTKLFFALSLLVAVVFSSCSSDETYTSSNDARTPEQILKEINKNNPMSLVGIKHNEEVEKLTMAFEKYTRAGGLSEQEADSILREMAIAEYYQAYDTLYDANSYNLQLSEFLDIYDYSTVRLKATKVNPNANDSIYQECFDSNQISILETLNQIVSNTTSSPETVLSHIQGLDNDISTQIHDINKRNSLYAITSVAANSVEYWSNQQRQKPGSPTRPTKTWNDIVNADISAAKTSFAGFVISGLAGGPVTLGWFSATIAIGAGLGSFSYAYNLS